MISFFDLQYNKLKKSTSLFNFYEILEEDLQVFTSPINELGYFSTTTNEQYFHKYSLDLTNYSVGDIIYFKIYVKDDVNPISEIPNNGSPFTFLRHFSIKII